MDILFVFWIAALGACVGSFLNVVIYRWPRGLSLVHPGSRCPHCQHPIRWYHNIPVLSWFAIKGRCHDCGAAISARYPMVEGLTGGTFVAVALAEPLSFEAGWRLFIPGPDGWITVARWAVWGYHVFLLCTLLCLAMIEWDAKTSNTARHPWPIWAVALLIGIGVPVAAAPTMFVFVPADERLAQMLSLDLLPGVNAGHFLGKWLGESIGGCAVGFSWGMGSALLIFSASTNGAIRKQSAWFACGGLVLAGTFVGMEGAFEIALATAALFVVASGLARLRSKPSPPPWSLCLFGITLAWLVLWKPLVGWQPLLDPEPQWLFHLAMIPVFYVLVLGAWLLRR